MKVFVIAMDSEALCVCRHLDEACEEKIYGRRVIRGKFNKEDVVVVVSGIGKGNAAAATQLAVQFTGTKVIFNIGLAGGNDTSMKVGDIYEVSDAVQYDFDLTKINGTECGTLNERESPFIPCRAPGILPAKRLATGDRFTDSVEDLEMLNKLKASLRDMEGAAIAHVCEYAGVDLISYKCVSDLIWRGDATGEFTKNLSSCLEKLWNFTRELLFADV